MKTKETLTTRELALEQWNKLSLEEKFYKVIPWLKSQGRDTTERHPDSLTGKEIEEIWLKETKKIENEVFSTKINEEDAFDNGSGLYEGKSIISKPNQKQFKEFSSIHFEKYLDKFNNDSYMAMIGCIAERLNKQEIATCMAGFKNLFEQFE